MSIFSKNTKITPKIRWGLDSGEKLRAKRGGISENRFYGVLVAKRASKFTFSRPFFISGRAV